MVRRSLIISMRCFSSPSDTTIAQRLFFFASAVPQRSRPFFRFCPPAPWAASPAAAAAGTFSLARMNSMSRPAWSSLSSAASSASSPIPAAAARFCSAPALSVLSSAASAARASSCVQNTPDDQRPGESS